MNDEEDVLPDTVDRAQNSKRVHRVSGKLKYKEKGYRIERTSNGDKWTLERYYRSETDMRRAYKACDGAAWSSGYLRMVFPDGRIIPAAHNEAHHSYKFRKRWVRPFKPITPEATPNFSPSNSTNSMNEDADPDMMALREELDRHLASGTPIEIIYFGGGQPGERRAITPLRYCEKRGQSHLIALCHRSGIEKTYRLDRMHLPEPPLADGKNDFRILAKFLGNARLIEGMLSQISRLGNLPMEHALAAHFERLGEFESFFDEYAYGGYTLELQLTSTVIYLSLGYEANAFETIHYQFTPEREPRLTPEIATHYSLYLGGTAPHRMRNQKPL